jgi:uncharacterized DUF497 family protein
MLFDFDKSKSALNKEKHGIDFLEAQTLWNDPNRIEIPARVVGESRQMLIGMTGSICWSAVFVYRKESIRIISVRRSRQNEKELYQNG